MEIDPQTARTSHPRDEAKAENKVIVVFLVGSPGSGKSTFCESVIRVSTRSWSHICQDTIGNGKAGTKTQCLRSAAAALKEGKSLFIDRCNLGREQRAEFLKLGGAQVENHAVVLDLPAELCISRSVRWSGHEGDLLRVNAVNAAVVVNKIMQIREFPKLSEGFTRIMLCQNEDDVEAALDTYSALGPLDTLPSGYFARRNPNEKIQLDIMKFLQKGDLPANTQSKSDVPQDTSKEEVCKCKASVSKGQESGPTQSSPMHSDVRKGVEQLTSSSKDVPILAFPSISTSDFQLDLEMASDIIVEKVEEYSNKLGNARIILVDISQSSRILALVRKKAAQKNIDSSKFFTFVGDIAQLYSKGGIRCNFIANATNWRLISGGGGVNAAIYNAAGPELEKAAKERAASLPPGSALIVPLPSTSPLFIKEGVTHVIHVLGPDMNPHGPNCLNNDHFKGSDLLREAYSSLFDAFAHLVGTKAASSRSYGDKFVESQDPSTGNSIRADQKVKRKALDQPDRNKKYKGFHKEVGVEVSSSASGRDNPKIEETKSMSKTKTWSPYVQSLYYMAMHPSIFKNEVLEVSEDFIVTNDRYPKAQIHLLVLARAEGLDSLADVRKEHLYLLKTMHSVGLKHAAKFLEANDSLVFRLGYHSVSSMRQLHLHLISQDFDSKHLKRKGHWNSFNTPFFRDSADVIEEVGENGQPTIRDDDGFREMELRCHRCRSALRYMTHLKIHINLCRHPFPSALLQNGRLIFASGKNGVSQ